MLEEVKVEEPRELHNESVGIQGGTKSIFQIAVIAGSWCNGEVQGEYSEEDELA